MALVDAWRDGVLDEAGLERLAALLREGSPAAHAAWAALRADADLAAVLASDADELAQGFERRLAAEADAEHAVDARIGSFRRRRAIARWGLGAGALAAAGIAAIIVLTSDRPSPAPRPLLTAQTPVERPPADGVPLPKGPAQVSGEMESVEGEETLVRFDFEQSLDPRWRAGRLTKGPPRGRSRFCLSGEAYNRPQPSLGVRLEDPAGLFPYSQDLAVRFVYWLGEPIGARRPYIEVSFFSARTAQEYILRIRDTAGGGWKEAAVRLAEGRPYHAGGVRPADGDRITLLKIKTTARMEDVFFVDDVTVVRQPSN
jgi:hypothetical protein